MAKGIYVRTKPAWNKGKTGWMSEQGKESIRRHNRSPANPRWKGGITSEPNYYRDYYHKNRKAILERLREWRRITGKHYGYTVKYKKKNIAKVRFWKSQRHFREKNAVGSFTIEQWEEIKKANGQRCAKCGEKKKLTIDHIIPLSRGGSNRIENIQPLCKSCNCKKHATIQC